jgi:hypothetical protein
VGGLGTVQPEGGESSGVHDLLTAYEARAGLRHSLATGARAVPMGGDAPIAPA